MQNLLICVNPKCRFLIDLRRANKAFLRSGLLMKQCPECGQGWASDCPSCGRKLEITWRKYLPKCSHCNSALRPELAQRDSLDEIEKSEPVTLAQERDAARHAARKSFNGQSRNLKKRTPSSLPAGVQPGRRFASRRANANHEPPMRASSHRDHLQDAGMGG